MTQFLNDLFEAVASFGNILYSFSTSYWVFPVLLFFFVSVFFFLITDNK